MVAPRVPERVKHLSLSYPSPTPQTPRNNRLSRWYCACIGPAAHRRRRWWCARHDYASYVFVCMQMLTYIDYRRPRRLPKPLSASVRPRLAEDEQGALEAVDRHHGRRVVRQHALGGDEAGLVAPGRHGDHERSLHAHASHRVFVWQSQLAGWTRHKIIAGPTILVRGTHGAFSSQPPTQHGPGQA
jgi:hypothetical protein